jgi:predicted dehydrogenase
VVNNFVLDRKKSTGQKESTILKEIYLFGGGRWARVLVGVLCSLPLARYKVIVFSPSNSNNMRQWVLEAGFEQLVDVKSTYPVFQNRKNCVAIIANAAKDHAQAVERCLLAGIPTLVEKPFTLTLAQATTLSHLAAEKNVLLATAHVFLFTRYLKNFSDNVKDVGVIKRILIAWEDPKAEVRYGEHKLFDSSLPILHDLLPHVISIIWGVLPDRSFKFHDLKLSRGGAQVAVSLHVGDTLCDIELVRNGIQRKRIMHVYGDGCSTSIDFSVEPGVIEAGGKTTDADFEWATGMRPLATMLTSFLECAETGVIDDRLKPRIALEAAGLADVAYGEYKQQQNSWLSVQSHPEDDEDATEDVQYAINEKSAVCTYLQAI